MMGRDPLRLTCRAGSFGASPSLDPQDDRKDSRRLEMRHDDDFEVPTYSLQIAVALGQRKDTTRRLPCCIL